MGKVINMFDFNDASPQISWEDRENAVRYESKFRVLEVLQHLLPHGVLNGKEFRAGNVYGDKGKSFGFNTETHKWKDFNGDERGGDLIGLWRKCRNVTYSQAVEEMESFLGCAPRQVKIPKQEQEKLPPPTKVWDYTTADGKLVAQVMRFDTDGKKQFRPFNVVTQTWKHPDPCILYNQPGIAVSQTVVIVEGEKCADALIGMGICATTAMGGSSNPTSKTDWSPLHGKKIIIWPDNDPAGEKLADNLMKIFPHATRLKAPLDKPQKWDAADAVAEGFDVRSFLNPPKKTPFQFNLHEWGMGAFQGEAAQRDWIVNATIPCGSVTLLAAAGDTGKGFLSLDLAYKIAKGPSNSFMAPVTALGNTVTGFGSAVIFTAEDDKDEMHRRLQALDPYGARHELKHQLYIVPLPNAGGPFSIITPGVHGPIVTAEFNAIFDILSPIPDLKLIIFDPLASFVNDDVNADPAVGAFLTGKLSSLATQLKCAVIVCHHMAKGNVDKAIKNPIQARNAIRGTTALVDGVRSAYALWTVDEKSARRTCNLLNIVYKPNVVVNGCIVKSNGPSDREIKTFIRNDFGLLEVRNDDINRASMSPEQIKEIIVETVAEAAQDGKPFSKHGKTSSMYGRQEDLPPTLQALGRTKLEAMVTELLVENKLVKGAGEGEKNARYLDVPGGDFALGQGVFDPAFRKPGRNVPNEMSPEWDE